MPEETVKPLSESFSPGQRIAGRYILKRLLGRGGMSVVWLAWDSKVEHEIALKFLAGELWGDKGALERLRMETKRSLQLTHPNIVRIYDFIHEPRHAAIAMEYVDGWSLWALRVDRPQKRYRIEEIFPWVQQLCSALDYAHNHVGIVHCDLKPSNLMLNSRGFLKVTDFGLAQRVRGINLRTENLIIGTDGFMSPQRAQGLEISLLDDIYSLGATIFDLLTGSPPLEKIEDADDLARWKAPKMNERLNLRDGGEEISPVWEDTVAACLDPLPSRRPQSAEAVLRLLERTEVVKPVEPIAVSEKVGGEKVESAGAEISPAVELNERQIIETLPRQQAQPAPQRKISRRTVVIGALAALVLFAGILVAVKLNSDSSEGLFSGPHKPGYAGTLDLSFSVGEGANREIRWGAIQPDGKILVGGAFDDFSGSRIRGLARLGSKGDVDKSFVPQPGGTVHAVAVTPDGKIVAGGEFVNAQGEPRRRAARFYDDGSLDPTFNHALNREVRAIAVQPDGKIILAGSFDTMSGKRQNRIARFNADGTPDESFNIGNGAPAIIWALALQPDGKILAGGNFVQFDDKPFARIVRLKSDGSVDETFDPGAGVDGSVYAIAVQDDGKILIAGDFIQVRGTERNRIARLNRDGSLDAKFNAGVGPNSGVRCLVVQADGKILVGGVFTSVQGVSRNRIARLKPNGVLDTSFDPGDGASDVVRWIGLQSDGKILIAGGLKKFDGEDVGRIVRLNGGPKMK